MLGFHSLEEPAKWKKVIKVMVFFFVNVGRAEPGPQFLFVPQHSKGLDSSLAKAYPSSENLISKTYRSYRRRLELFRSNAIVVVVIRLSKVLS